MDVSFGGRSANMYSNSPKNNLAICMRLGPTSQNFIDHGHSGTCRGHSSAIHLTAIWPTFTARTACNTRTNFMRFWGGGTCIIGGANVAGQRWTRVFGHCRNERFMALGLADEFKGRIITTVSWPQISIQHLAITQNPCAGRRLEATAVIDYPHHWSWERALL